MFWIWDAFYKRNYKISPGKAAKERFEASLSNGEFVVVNLSVVRDCPIRDLWVEYYIEKRFVFLDWKTAPRSYYRRHYYQWDFRQYFKRWRKFATDRKTAKRNAARVLVDFLMPIIYSPWLSARGRPGYAFIRLQNKLENNLL
jgi:hypothetical protein